MNDDLEKRLASEIGTCLFSDLRAHIERDVVILVHPDLSLLEVALCVARDKTHVVQDWILKKQMKKPSQKQLERWNEDDTRSFRSVIVRPYVLVQELPAADPLAN